MSEEQEMLNVFREIINGITKSPKQKIQEIEEMIIEYNEFKKEIDN